jgi:hypothetical protein
MLAIFLAKGDWMSKEWDKTHLSKVLGDYAPMISSKQDRAVQICAPRSTAHSKIRTPLAFRSLGEGGGSGIGGATLRRSR